MILRGMGLGGNLITRGLGLWYAVIERLMATLRALDGLIGRLTAVERLRGRL